MCAVEPNLVQTPFFLALEFLLKTALLRSLKHRSITIHSYFRCESLHWSFQSQKYLLKFRLFHYHRYLFVANTPTVAFLLIVARFYIDSFILKRIMLIHPKNHMFPIIRSSVHVFCAPSNPLLPMLDT